MIIEIFIAKENDESHSQYGPFTDSVHTSLPRAYKRCAKLKEDLGEQGVRFNIYSVNIPMTHSIGLYDDRLFISDFFFKISSSKVPSYELRTDGPSFSSALSELLAIAEGSEPFAGSGPAFIAKILATKQ